MSRSGRILAWIGLCIGLVLCAPAAAAPPPIPATPAPVMELVSARPFTLDEALTHHWRAEHRSYRQGYLLVLRVDPALVYPRQVEEPVLYVGTQSARRMNVGYEDGHVIAILPVEDLEKYKLGEQRVWFGDPAFPEQVDDEHVEAQVELAKASGIVPIGKQPAETALDRGGDAIEAATLDDLLPVIGSLVERYAPSEKELVESLKQTGSVAGRPPEGTRP